MLRTQLYAGATFQSKKLTCGGNLEPPERRTWNTVLTTIVTV